MFFMITKVKHMGSTGYLLAKIGSFQTVKSKKDHREPVCNSLSRCGWLGQKHWHCKLGPTFYPSLWKDSEHSWASCFLPFIVGQLVFSSFLPGTWPVHSLLVSFICWEVPEMKFLEDGHFYFSSQLLGFQLIVIWLPSFEACGKTGHHDVEAVDGI